MSAATKTDQAEALMKEARKLASRTLLKWKPEYDQAAIKFDKAGHLFKSLNSIAKAKEAYFESSECHRKAGNTYLAAKARELVGNTCRDDKDNEAAARHFEGACELYKEDGKADKAVEMLMKSAKLTTNVDKAVQLFSHAVDLIEADGRWHMSGDTFRTITAFLVKNNRYADAINNLKRQIKAFEAMDQQTNIWKAALSIVVLFLALNDWVAADNEYKAFLEREGFSNTNEEELCQRLLQTFDERDDEALQLVLKDQMFGFIENEIGKVAKRLRVFGEKKPRPEIFDDEEEERGDEGRPERETEDGGAEPRKIPPTSAAASELEEDDLR